MQVPIAPRTARFDGARARCWRQHARIDTTREIDNTREIDDTKIDNTEIHNTEIDNTETENTEIDNSETDNTREIDDRGRRRPPATRIG